VTGETRRKERIGVVVSNKMQKTVVVAIETFKRHRIYKKILRQTRRFKVHDENSVCGLGDLVRIVETRPLSREKRWRVAEVLVRGEVAEVKPQEIDAELIEELSAKMQPPEAAPAAPAETPVTEAVVEPEAVAEAPEAVVEPEAVAEAPEAVVEAEAVAEAPEAVVEPEAVAEATQEAPESEEER
jgi:small subunit ribosomal protein S17